MSADSSEHSVLNNYFANAHNGTIEIIGFGSLLSERSSRTTFPNLKNFRVVKVEGYRRVFRHAPSIFFERGIADLSTLRVSSLSCEKAEGSSFLAVVFSVTGESSESFLRREEEFDFEVVPYSGVDTPRPASSHDANEAASSSNTSSGQALMCVHSTDAAYVARWGRDMYETKYKSAGIPTIWGWNESSGILPCSVYLRHCYLAAKGLAEKTSFPAVLDSFLDDTFLADRSTSIRTYLERNPEVLTQLPPEALVGRYSG